MAYHLYLLLCGQVQVSTSILQAGIYYVTVQRAGNAQEAVALLQQAVAARPSNRYPNMLARAEASLLKVNQRKAAQSSTHGDQHVHAGIINPHTGPSEPSLSAPDVSTGSLCCRSSAVSRFRASARETEPKLPSECNSQSTQCAHASGVTTAAVSAVVAVWCKSVGSMGYRLRISHVYRDFIIAGLQGCLAGLLLSMVAFAEYKSMNVEAINSQEEEAKTDSMIVTSEFPPAVRGWVRKRHQSDEVTHSDGSYEPGGALMHGGSSVQPSPPPWLPDWLYTMYYITLDVAVPLFRAVLPILMLVALES